MRPSASLVLVASLLAASVGCGSKRTSPGGTSGAPASASVAAVAVASAAPSASADAQRCAPRSGRRLERAAVAGASSSVELVRSAGKTFALVADDGERALHVVDVETMRQVSVTPLPGRPNHVRALASGMVAATLRDTGRVVLLEATDDALEKPFEERCSAAVAVEPWALAEAGGKVLVSSGFGAALTALRAADLGLVREVSLPREPRAVLVAGGGKTVFVSHAVGGIVSTLDPGDLAAEPGRVSLRADVLEMDVEKGKEKPPRFGSQGYALAAVTGKQAGGEQGELRILAPHTSLDPGAPDSGPTTSGYGGDVSGAHPIAPTVSVIDPLKKVSITGNVLLARESSLLGRCFLPRGAVADQKSLFVACLDLDAVLELDPMLSDPILGELRKLPVPAGPEAVTMTLDGKRLVVFSAFDRALSRIERDGWATQVTTLWRRSGETRDAKIDRGRRLFHTSRDARISKGRACASCHPEGRDDGIVWGSPDGPRQTMMLAGRIAGTGPYGWFGESPSAREHIKKTFGRLGGVGFGDPRSAEDLDALLAYIEAIPPPPTAASPDVAAVARGKELFSSKGCEACHKSGGTNGVAYDVGSGSPKERRSTFDTPSLRGIRGSAPYFHDGRYATLDQMLSATDTRMIPEPLSEPEKKALLAFLETL